MNKTFIFLFLILTIAVVCPTDALAQDEEEEQGCTLTMDEAFELLAEQPWEGFWHSHDTTNMPRHSQESGEHFHATHRDVIDADGCLHATFLSVNFLHETSDPADPPPTVSRDFVGDIEFTDDDDPENPTPEQAPTEYLIPESHQPTTYDPAADAGRQSEETAGTPESETITPESETQTPPDNRQVIRTALVEIASGARDPVETTDPTTGETTLIDPVEAQAIIDSGALDEDSNAFDHLLPLFGDLSKVAAELPRQALDITPTYQPLDVVVTEYMLRVTENKLPQWIEIHNKEDRPISLEGFKLSVWRHQDRANIITLSRWAYIPANGFLILVNRKLTENDFGGINDKRVKLYELRDLGKYRWIKRFRLYDPQGTLVANGDQYDPERPEIKEGVRYSYDAANKKIIKWRKNKAWIGSPDDRSTLGWHAFQEEVPASPRRITKKTLSWASLKRGQDR